MEESFGTGREVFVFWAAKVMKKAKAEAEENEGRSRRRRKPEHGLP
jgi:hypothetical protein